jgi:hypothetical protein
VCSRSSYPPIGRRLGEFAELSRAGRSITRELEKSLRSLSDRPAEAVRAGNIRAQADRFLRLLGDQSSPHLTQEKELPE